MAHIQNTLERAVALRDDFSQLLQAMDAIARGEGRIVELQSVLTDNLRVLRETQTTRWGDARIDRIRPVRGRM